MLDELFTVMQRRRRPCWLVGGTVRDREMGRAAPDVDVVVDDDPAAVAFAVASAAGLPWFALSHEFGAYRVVGRGGHLDVAGLRGGHIAADLALRDLTVNAMALPLAGGPLVDPFDGRSHLAQRSLVAVGDSIFADDPLRLMRVARLAHTLGFGIAPRLRERTREDAGLLSAAAAERVLSEVALTLAVGRTAAAACLWDHLGLLPSLFPEIAALRGIQQSDFHHLDAYHHTLETARRVDEIVAQPGRWFGGSWQPLEERLAMPVDGMLSRPVVLRLAALLHDIGKATTRGVDAQGRIMFWGHTTEGARIVRGVNRRLKLSAKAGTLLRTVVGEHLSIGKLERDAGDSSRGAVRYLWQTAPWTPEVIMVSTADRLATQGPLTGRARILAQLALASRLMACWWERERDGVPRPPLDGDGLQAALGLSPGPLLGEVLQEVRLAAEADEIATPGEALALARAYLEERARPASGADSEV